MNGQRIALLGTVVLGTFLLVAWVENGEVERAPTGRTQQAASPTAGPTGTPVSPANTDFCGERHCGLIFFPPERVRPNHSDKIVLELPCPGQPMPTPEGPPGSQEPHYGRYAAAKVTAPDPDLECEAACIGCDPKCAALWEQEVLPNGQARFEWMISTGPSEKTYQATVIACWISSPGGPCDERLPTCEHPFHMEVTTGATGVMGWFENLAWLWRTLTASGPVPWSLLLAWYAVRPRRPKLRGALRKLGEFIARLGGQ